MDLQDVKNLSKKRLLNMKVLYEKAGLSVTSINSRISRMEGQLHVGEANRLELAAIELVGQILEALKINPVKLANYLGLALDYEALEQDPGELVEPYGYISKQKSAMPVPVFALTDKLRRRVVASGSGQSQFVRMERIREMIQNDPDFHPTGRGQYVADNS